MRMPKCPGIPERAGIGVIDEHQLRQDAVRSYSGMESLRRRWLFDKPAWVSSAFPMIKKRTRFGPEVGTVLCSFCPALASNSSKSEIAQARVIVWTATQGPVVSSVAFLNGKVVDAGNA